MEITSRTNARLKLVRSLLRRKDREESGLFRVEGLAHVGAALETNAPVEFLIASPAQFRSDYAHSLIAQATQKDIPVFEVSPDIFTSLAEKENPQGILAIVRRVPSSLPDFSPTSHPWLVAAVAPQDPGNVGTLLRTIDAVGASGLVLLDDSVDPTHPTAVRASLGSLFWIPIVSCPFAEFASWVKETRYACYGSSARGEQDFRAATYRQPAVLLLGSERTGLEPEHAAICDTMIRLPMNGKSTSLNLSVAAGVLLYQMQSAFSDQ